MGMVEMTEDENATELQCGVDEVSRGDVNTFMNTSKPAAKGLADLYTSDQKMCIKEELVERGISEEEASNRLKLEN